MIRMIYETEDQMHPDWPPERTLTMETRSVTLDAVLEDIAYFLRGAGFFFDGEIQVVKEEWDEVDE